ncbi:MAG: FAD binding domain-containing protein [Solirubrobacteraceae bacterium]
MLLSAVEYIRPESIEEAISALGSAPTARVLAGGQSLINVLKHRVATCDLLVDVSRLEVLRGIEVGSDGSAEIGAAVTYDELDRSTALRTAHAKVSEVAAFTVDQQVRCRGTLGGNACFSDPTSNFPPLLVALEATMVITGPDGEREVPADDFFRGPLATAVEPGELLRAIRLPPLGGRGIGYVSIQLAEDSWALARACAVLTVNGVIEDVRVVLGCVAPTPRRASALEERLRCGRPTVETIEAAAPAAREGLAPVSDVHASGEYRREMAAVAAKRALIEASGIPA